MIYKIFQASPWVDTKEKKYLFECIKSNKISEGVFSEKFKKKIKKITKSKFVSLAPNGTLGLYIAIKSLNLPQNSEIIVPNFSFYASATSVVFAGMKPVFADVNRDDFNLDPKKIQKLITKKTSAIMIVHTYGQSAKIDEIIKISRKYNLKIIEDAAQAFNIFYKNKHCGTFGDVGVISFFADKSITTGEGATILTQKKKIYKKIQLLRNQGREKSGTFIHKDLGMNFRTTDLQSAVGLAQLNKISKIEKERISKYNTYMKSLKNVGDLKFIKKNDQSNYIPFRFCVLTVHKSKLMNYLEKNKIQTRSFFYPLNMQPKMKIYKSGSNTISKELYRKGICLPIHHDIKNKDIKFICNTIKNFFKNK